MSEGWRTVGLWGGVAVVAGLLLVASLVPVPGGSGGPVDGRVPFALAHLFGYGLLAAVLALAVGRTPRPRWQVTLAVFAAVVGYGATIEVLQGRLAHRTFSYGDIALNALGAAAGLACVWLWDRVGG